MYFTYMVRCSDDTLYTGYTDNLDKRINAHNEKRGAKYTRARTPVSLVYYECLDTRQSAMKRECAIKKLTRAEKERLIDNFNRERI